VPHFEHLNFEPLGFILSSASLSLVLHLEHFITITNPRYSESTFFFEKYQFFERSLKVRFLNDMWFNLSVFGEFINITLSGRYLQYLRSSPPKSQKLKDSHTYLQFWGWLEINDMWFKVSRMAFCVLF
jgi:hypothetical protein